MYLPLAYSAKFIMFHAPLSPGCRSSMNLGVRLRPDSSDVAQAPSAYWGYRGADADSARRTRLFGWYF